MERLRALKKLSSQVGTNAREAVRFLDRETSGRSNITRVVLQGPDECFDAWDEVQEFFLPEFEEEVSDHGHDSAETTETRRRFAGKLSILHNGHSGRHDVSDSTTSRSTIETTSSSHPSTPERDISIDPVSQETADPGPVFAPPPVPEFLKSLLNSVLWTLHCSDSSSPVNSHFLITNDWEIQNWAVKYGISVKNIHQLRTAILYEDKEVKNHTKYIEKTQNATEVLVPTTASTTAPANGVASDASETEEVTFVPREQEQKLAVQSAGGRKGHHRKHLSSSPNSADVRKVQSVSPTAPSKDTVLEIPSVPIDPDSFDRNICVAGSVPPEAEVSERSVLANHSPISTRGGSGGRRGLARGAMRGNSRGSRGKLWVP